MKQFRIAVFVLSTLAILSFSSCEEPDSLILGIWTLDTREITIYEEGEVAATATYYHRVNGDGYIWEFQEEALLAYDADDFDLDNSYDWMIENGEKLILTVDDFTNTEEYDILALSSKKFVVQAKYYEDDQLGLASEKIVLSFIRLEE